MPAAALTPTYPSGYGPKPNSVPQQQANAASPAAGQSYQNLQSWFNANLPAFLPQIQQQQNAYQNAANQLPAINANYQQQEATTQQEAGYQQQAIGLQQQQQAIQQGALLRQEQLQPELYGIQQQQYGIQQGALERQKALDPRQQAITEAGFGQSAKDIAAQYGQTQRATESAGVTGGGLFTHGQADIQKFQAEQHASQVGSLARAKQSEELGYREQIASLQDQFKSLNLQRQGSGLNFAEQMASLQDQQKNLGILSQQLGLSSQEITTRTQNALQQLGLGNMVSDQQVYQAMIDASNGTANPLTSIIGQVYQLGGIRPVSAPTGGK